jgi:D-amino-acid dehydrogenase
VTERTEASGAGEAVVVGAGIVGTCCALYLQRDGWRVTLLERDEPGRGCSFGNAGIRPSDVSPAIATPGILWRVPRHLLDPEGPLRVDWRYLPRLAPWLFRFVRASRRDRYEASTRALATLLAKVRESYAPLVEGAGAEDLVRRTGTLHVYESEASFRDGRQEAAFRQRLGARLDILAPDEIRQFAPGLAPIFRGAIYRPEVDYVANPFRLTQTLIADFQRRGGVVRRATALSLRAADRGRTAVTLDPEGAGSGAATETLEADRVVIATGAWSKPLVRTAGVKVPLDTERGYHAMLPDPGIDLRLPVSSAEGAFYVTPMEEGLRIAGTVELAGLRRAPDPRRVEVMLRRTQRFFPTLDTRRRTEWMGFRPSMPDSLPVISRVPGRPGLLLAFGHGHLGLTLAGVTGRLIADLAAERTPAVDVAPFRSDRF